VTDTPLIIHLPRRRFLGSLGALSALALVGCAAPSTGGSTASSASGSTGGKLRVGLLPIVDALPIYVADSEGFFKAQNLSVDLSLFASALERDAAFQAGQLDVELNDLVSAALLNKDGNSARVIRLSYRGNPKMPMMTILAAPGSSIMASADLKNVPIAISGNSVIEYATDQMLSREGVAPSDIQKTEVSKIPVRVEMLSKGQVQAATLPEPFTSLALAQGARRILDDGQTGIGCSVITSRKSAVDTNSAQLKAFLAAYDQAVTTIAASPEKYRALFVDKAKIPDQLQTTLAIPPYPKSEVPTQDEVDAVGKWAVAKGLVPKEVGYASMVDASLLPKGS
jgi:NitT/TauT family transport system substrate-binding protein